MSNLGEHMAEQELITAQYEASQRTSRFRYICPSCGEESLYHSDDVTLYWDTDSQKWEVSDDGFPDENSNLYCGDCDHICESNEAKQEIER